MSYILDALKKADAEREREAAPVPDLYAQADAARGARAAARPGRGGLLAAALTLVAVAGLAWQWFGTASVEVAAPPAAIAPPALPQPPAPAPVVGAAPAPAPTPAPASALAPALPAATPAAIAATPARALPSARQAMAPVAPKPAAAAAASQPATSQPLTLADLPADVRGKLPALVVGGSVYSPNAASRIVILNGQVFREGDQPAEGLAVERIGLKSTVMAFRGLRFELKH